MSSAPPPMVPEPTEGNLTQTSAESTRRCFVCLTDEGDPAGPSEVWVNPCPCTLAAHQECMLMFVADCEREHRPLRCPICKSTIQLVQPFDPAIWLSKTAYAAMCKVSPYVLAIMFTGGTLAGSASYGLASLVVFAGPQDALRALWKKGAEGLAWYRRIHWGPTVHLPFIGPVLFLNRFVRLFGYALAVPNFISYIVLARLAPHDELFRWPPSPWWIMAITPTVRKLYFSLYKDIFGDLEKRLEREYKALQGNTRLADQPAQNNDAPPPQPENAHHNNAHEQVVPAEGANPDEAAADAEAAPIPAEQPAVAAEVQLRANVGEGWADAILGFLGADDDDEWEDIADEDDHNRPGHRHRRRRRRHQVGNGVQEQIIDIVEEDVPADGEGRQGNRQGDRQGNRQDDAQRNNGGNEFPALIDIANSVVRSLLFPGFAFLGGEMLRLILPRSWSQRPYDGRPTGLFQQQWGRSLAGGCLYVVFRDLFRLWVKYRIVTVYPQRRVKDMGKYKPGGGNRTAS